ncbi:thermonuclease family protein [Metabacillus litoralis]|uniref:thermonuclease family protein n=1 Tax=Metabacillus litoralis TaxID=152268 RepID=UPI00203C5541|nr:thermonuclease family protein [Metabacillus litoralis]MCM3160191.1 thermonuclease family protein [Metabacillus litoralis]
MRKKLIILFFPMLMFLVTIACSTNQDSKNLVSAKVVNVVDGDTLNVMISGKEETIRLLLVDTPETVHPTKPVQPFGLEASNYLKELLNGKDVQVEVGIGERDKYGRLLGYVYIDKQMVNKLLLQKGLARVAYVFEPNTKYIDEFNSIQKQAQQNKVGIWSIENYATDEGFQTTLNEEQNEINPNLQVNEECTIKGNINSKGEKIFHTEQSPSYELTKPEAMFCTEDEARAAGYRAVKR